MAQTQVVNKSLSKPNQLHVDHQRSKLTSGEKYTIVAKFFHLDGQAQPGLNTAHLPLDPNCWIASAFPTEIDGSNKPIIGAANFDILSVEVDQQQAECEVRFNLDYSVPLSCAIMAFLAYSS